MALTLHEHPFAAYCWKALIALYELELPFDRHRIEGDATLSLPNRFLFSTEASVDQAEDAE